MKKIGLLGGSFDPPHQGHIHLSHRALAAFALDKIWWLVSPQNPLKPPPTHDYPTRIAACQTIATDPRIIIKDWELRIPSPYTIDSLTALKTRYRTTNFVFLMGADSFASLHTWHAWQRIIKTMPIGVIARPHHQIAAGKSPAGRQFANARLATHDSQALPYRPAPCWCLSIGALHGQSSTDLRAQNSWRKNPPENS